MFDKQKVFEIRRQLRYTWSPFFSRFGRLTEIQVKAIPKILAGCNIVSAAPTASGKTESVVAPVAELAMAQKWQGLSVLYIVPTRALANDSLARIEGPLSALNLSVILKHGDKSSLPKKVPNWLITTPESLDSLLCRKIDLLRNLQVIIIDEIHLIDNTYRGDQMRILLARLNQVSKNAPLSIHLLSATLPDPATVAQRYITPCEIVNVEGQRAIESYILESHQDIFNLARKNHWNKVLYFCNSRASVEETAKTIKKFWKPYPVVSHHGSLDRSIREDTEMVMKQNKVAACVATSTLEIGIDIGDIDLVILAEPPHSRSAMLQRVGRGNRRSGKIQVAALANGEPEKQMLEWLLSRADLPLELIDYYPDYSVVVQQIFSYLFQNQQGVTYSEIYSLLRFFCGDEVNADIINYLVDSKKVNYERKKLYLTETIMNMTVRGQIHCNIPSGLVLQVIDITTGQKIGKIFESVDDIFTLGGRNWKILSSNPFVVKVKPYYGQCTPPKFNDPLNNSYFRNIGYFNSFLPEKYRR